MSSTGMTTGYAAGAPARAWVVAPLVLVALLAGWLLPYDQQVAIVAVPIAAALTAWVVLAAVRRPAQAVSLLIVVGVLVPFELEGGINAALPLSATIVSAWTATRLLSRRFSLDRSGVVWATAALMAAMLLSFVAGQFPRFHLAPAPLGAQIGGLVLCLASGGLLILMAKELGTEWQIRRVTWVFLGAGTVALLIMAVGAGEIGTGRLHVQTSASIGSVFYTWFVALAAGQAFWNRGLTRSRRAGLVAMAVLAIGYQLLVAFSWKSAWMPPSVALGLLLGLRFPRSTVAVSLVAAPLALFWMGSTVDPVLHGEDYSLRTRVAAAAVIVDLIAQSPWLGFGPANYHFYTPLFPILGYRVPFNSHNNYLDVAAEAGLVGLAAFVAVLVAVSVTSLRWGVRCRPGFAKGYLLAGFAATVGTAYAAMLGDWVIPFVYNVGTRGFRSSLLFWVFSGGVVACVRVLRLERRAGFDVRTAEPART